MAKDRISSPPRWAERFLEWYCRPELCEDLHGDLNEYFQRNLEMKGVHYARWIYVIDVVKFIRPYTLAKPNFIYLLIHRIMLRSYVKTSGRNIVKNKLFSTINIVGLAISMSVGLLMISFLADLKSYDRFNVKGDRIYRLTDTYSEINRPSRDYASTSVKAGKLIQERVAGIEDVLLLQPGFSSEAQFKETIVPVSGMWASASFFNFFSYHLLEGNPANALKEPYSIVLTKKAAQKIFGTEDALGKTISIQTSSSSTNNKHQTSYTITGIMQDVPKFSHIHFESLISFATKEIESRDDAEFMKWGNIWNNYTYFLLPPGGDVDAVQSNLDKLSKEENKALEHLSIQLKLQPLYQIVLGENMGNPIGPVLNASSFWTIFTLAIIVIISACFNYTNLSIARSLSRSREVGIRKVIGATKGHVLGQFLTESVLIACLALILSLGIFFIMRNQVLLLAPELQQIASLEVTLPMVVYFILFAVAVGLLAGVLPAMFYSRTSLIFVLKNVSSIKAFRFINLRKALIVTQYTFSLCIIIATMIMYKQYQHFLTYNLGFDTENIINIGLQGNPPDRVANEISTLSEVMGISRSAIVTSIGSYYSVMMRYNNSSDSSEVYCNGIDENYLALHQHTLIAGHNFDPRKEGDDETEVIVNERVLREFDIANQNPTEAIGEMVTIDGKKLQIVGVVKDFHYGMLNKAIGPFVFRYMSHEADYLNVKISSGDWGTTLDHVRQAWKRVDPVHPLRADFYSEQIEMAYNTNAVMIKILGFLAFLSISIASLGLFGMVVYITETRIKEISIRKVLGASESGLIYLISRGFLLLLAIAMLIALPTTYIFFNRVALANIVYRAPIGIIDLISGVLIVMAIALILIGSQTIKVARTNPAEVLKGE